MDGQDMQIKDPFQYSRTCPDVFNGGKDICSGEGCKCPQDGETVCIIGICVCMHERHLAFDEVSCSDGNHANILKNKNHSELNCPLTCHSTSENNSCPPSSLKKKDGKCYCADGSQVKPTITKDYKLHLPLLVCPNVPVESHGNVTHELHPGIFPTSRHFNVTSQDVLTSSLSSLYLLIPVSVIFCMAVSFFGVYLKYYHKQLRQPSFLQFQFLRWKRTNNEYHSNTTTQGNQGNDHVIPITVFPPNSVLEIPSIMEDNPSYFSMEFLIQSGSGEKLHDKLITNEKIKKGKRIGDGQFGEVYKGTYQSPDGVQEVAIKIPKITWNTGCSPIEVENLKSFYAEAQITIGFDHENVLSCLGISTGSLGEPWMVVEFMRFGDLADVLRTNSGVLSLQRSDSPILEMVDLLRISYQIACGMKYLTTQHFTHRDLAARNCLVGENLLVKISDFGLTRDIYSNEYYKVTGTERLLPVRWMAPESITHGKFTNETDVWSYGVVLWEIFTFGKVPYYLRTNKEVMEAVSLGHHLNPPEGCPDVIKTIMLSCWKLFPNDRIKFSTIVESLSEENLKKILDTSNSTYGKLRPLSYTDKTKQINLNRIEKSLLMDKNRISNSEQIPLMATEGSYNSFQAKLSSDQNSSDSLDAKQIDSRTPETEYTIILPNKTYDDDSKDLEDE